MVVPFIPRCLCIYCTSLYIMIEWNREIELVIGCWEEQKKPVAGSNELLMIMMFCVCVCVSSEMDPADGASYAMELDEDFTEEGEGERERFSRRKGWEKVESQ